MRVPTQRWAAQKSGHASTRCRGVHGTDTDRRMALPTRMAVTDHGQLLTIEGAIQEGAVLLEGSDRGAEGKPRLVRGTWQSVKDGVREVAVRSTDAGKDAARPYEAKRGYRVLRHDWPQGKIGVKIGLSR
jgi:hypothetical protein